MISPLFVELLYQTELSHHADKNDYFYKKVSDLHQQHIDDKSNNWLCDTFCTMPYLDLTKDPEFLPILDDIKKEIITFSKEFGVVTENIFCSEAWINLSEPGQHQEFHNHARNHFSIAYYIKTPKDSGGIIFRSHESDTDMFPLPAELTLPANFKSFRYYPKENDLLIFRSNMQHMVEKNKSNEDRVSISANFYFLK